MAVPIPKGINKHALPEKTFLVCKCPFAWRKKWEKS